METTLRISSGAISDKGLNEKRSENEDSYLEAPNYGIFAVADGVGGAQAGDVASQMAMEVISEAFFNLKPGTDPESVMQSAIGKANSAIFQMARDLPQLASMATTVVALHLNGNIATIGHVGDSRLYRVDREGNFFRDTDDHSMVAEEVRAGRMTEEQAASHPSRNIISRALGAEDSVSIDTKTVMIDGGTAFLLCSDGITRHVSDQEIKGVLTFGGAPADICEYLKDLCYHRGAEDNLTAVVVKTGTADGNQIASDNSFYPKGTLLAMELEESTMTSARPRTSNGPVADEPEDVLELDSQDDSHDGPLPIVPSPSISSHSIHLDSVDHQSNTQTPAPNTVFQIEPPGPSGSGNPAGNWSNDTSFSIFETGESFSGLEGKGIVSKALSAIALVALGAMLGMGAYYITSPKPVDTDGPRITEMRSANIPLSAFEENRRNVDRDPAGYIARYASDPQDCEDHYLLARAYLLVGDYANARTALTNSRDKLSDADPSNAAVLASDIAIAMSVTNGTTVQSMLKKELEFTKSTNTTQITNSKTNR